MPATEAELTFMFSIEVYFSIFRPTVLVENKLHGVIMSQLGKTKTNKQTNHPNQAGKQKKTNKKTTQKNPQTPKKEKKYNLGI